jgi:carbon storage regulator
MLVLTRRTGEEIVIGNAIRVTIVSVKGERVRLGITAARSVPVTRQELLAEHPQAQRRQPPGKTGRTR